MMKPPFTRAAGLLTILFASSSCFCQERDFPDYRSKKEIFARIQEKDVRSDLACFTFGGIDESVGRGKLPGLPVTHYGPKELFFAGKSNNIDIQVKITGGIFDESAHKYTYYNKLHLVKIDGRPFYGSYDELPETTIQSVVVVINKDTVVIPATAYNDLFNPEFTYMDKSGVVKSMNNVYLSPDKRTFYIYMLNRKPKANYEVTWVIQDRKYIRRVVDFGFLN
jgi:hypothetical protein